MALLGALSAVALGQSLPAPAVESQRGVIEARVAGGLAGLDGRVHTEDPRLNAVIRKIYRECIFSKQYDPLPPALPHKWFSPGGTYVGQWVWDTMFVLAVYAPAGDEAFIRDVWENYWYTVDNNPEAPKGSYRYGMVPNYLKEWPPVGYSQIPILAWGCRMLERQTDDRKLVERALPYLVAFDEWYSTERDVDGDGLIEYGTYKALSHAGWVQTARYESFDLEPTTKDMKLTKHPRRAEGGEWYGDREGVDQTCFLIMSERAIIEMARLLRDEKLARRYESVVERRVQAVQAKMWDPKTRFFYTLDRDSDRQLPIRTIQGFLTLTAEVATPEQAAALIEQLQDPKQWWCKYPVPTVAVDDPTYQAKGFWMGDMWPPTTYMVAIGLNRYGRQDLAYELTRKMVELYEQRGINERYDGTTGEPLGVGGLGMSCSVLSMAVENLYGVGQDFRTIRVPRDPAGRHLVLGKLEVRYPSEREVELRTGFALDLAVVFPGGGRLRVAVTADGSPLAEGQVKVEGRTVRFAAAEGKRYRVAVVQEEVPRRHGDAEKK